MTFREEMKRKYPWLYEEGIEGIVKSNCPSDLGFCNEEDLDDMCEANNEDCEKCWNRECTKEVVDMSIVVEKYDEGYNKGLLDAWELAKRLSLNLYKNGLSNDAINEIYGMPSYRVFEAFTPQEALAKLKAYEDSKIEVGDVVKNTAFKDEYIIFDTELGTAISTDFKKVAHLTSEDWKKTGKHIDIQSIFEQIGGE